ncbi:glycosyltransferase family 4 protein [Hoeflea sp.]|uniref:glycosyltransferase family 4 protein n=1 Tax=Hoeflea sp. TaxID=1940281 RepID=UPI0037494A7D
MSKDNGSSARPAGNHPGNTAGLDPLFVLNMHRNFTGVSATAAAVVRQQQKHYALKLVGGPLPGCPEPIGFRQAVKLSRIRPPGRPFHIWHVRRNPEMRAGIFARDVLRLPVKLVFTSSAQRRHSLLPRWLISKMDAVIATTPAAADFVPYVRAVAPHGVDIGRFHPAESRSDAWTATGYPGAAGIATIGRIRPEKGTDRFVDTMIRALPSLPGHTAIVIGKAAHEHTSFLNTLRTKVAEAGLGERILFPGELQADTMPGLIRGLSLLVALPRYEGYGVTPLEAMASGVPFVASDAGWFETFSGDGAAGSIVADGDPEAAAAATLEILSNRERHQAMAQAARERAASRFSVAAEANAINTVYQQLWSEAG